MGRAEGRGGGGGVLVGFEGLSFGNSMITPASQFYSNDPLPQKGVFGNVLACNRCSYFVNRVFLHDVTAAMLVSQNKEMADILVYQTKPL